MNITYYWVGGATGTNNTSYSDGLGTLPGALGTANYTWVRAFDWNNPANWRVQVGPPVPSGYMYITPTSSPSFGDIAIFGTPEYAGGMTGYQLPRAKAPCLWGGAVLSGATTSWKGGGSSGADYSTTSSTGGAMENIIISYNGGRPGTNYPFSFIGLPQNLQNAALGDSITSALLEATDRGFQLDDGTIWQGASWQELVDAVVGITSGASAGAQERLNQLRVRTKKVETPSIPTYPYILRFGQTGNNNINHGVISLSLIKNLQRYGVSGAYYNAVNTVCYLYGTPEYRIKGYASEIIRSVTPNPLTDIEQTPVFYSPRPHLLVDGLTAGKISIYGPIGSALFTSTSNIAQANLFPSTDYHLIQLHNKFNRTAVLGEIYPGGSGAGSGISSGTPNLTIANPTTLMYAANIQNGSSFHLYGVVLGSQNGETFSANYCKFGAPGSSGGLVSDKKLSINFGGNVNIDKMEAYNCNISAWKRAGIATDAVVSVGELDMYEGSKLDFSLVESFDNWNFGAQVGTEIIGGIVFNDETCTIQGSNGIRLWNDQLLSIGNIRTTDGSKRTGKIGLSAPTSIE